MEIQMKIRFASQSLPRSGVLVVFMAEDKGLGGLAARADERTKGQLGRAIKAAGFAGKRDQSLDVVAPGGGFDRIVVFGLGDPGKLRPLDVEMLGGAIAGTLQALKAREAAIAADVSGKAVPEPEFAALVASGARLRVYSFNTYKSKKPEHAGLSELALHVASPAAAQRHFQPLDAVAEGVHLARNLVNEPPNVLFPVEFAARAKALAKHGVKIEIMTPAQMKKLGMGAILGVAQGSSQEARIVVMRWDGGKRGEKPLAFIGKGVTFDTGGISIKPAAGMDEMKFDMGGAASVLGTLHAVARLKAKVNLIGIIPTCENMPSGRAIKPGDVVTSMSGQTIEILNTDAEGRLILCDALTYAERFKPAVVVDIATLTGACVVALGHHRTGLFSADDALAGELLAAGEQGLDPAWRLPLDEEYGEELKSNFADMANVGSRDGGAILAAMFLKRFAAKLRWAHLDIAGTAWNSGKAKGATGRPVPLLTHFVLSRAQ